MRETINIAAKMYRCQETAKKFFKDEYPVKIKWYTDVLKAVMIKENLDSELKAVLFVSEMESVKQNGMSIMMFMAAAVEISES